MEQPHLYIQSQSPSLMESFDDGPMCGLCALRLATIRRDEGVDQLSKCGAFLFPVYANQIGDPFAKTAFSDPSISRPERTFIPFTVQLLETVIPAGPRVAIQARIGRHFNVRRRRVCCRSIVEHGRNFPALNWQQNLLLLASAGATIEQDFGNANDVALTNQTKHLDRRGHGATRVDKCDLFAQQNNFQKIHFPVIIQGATPTRSGLLIVNDNSAIIQSICDAIASGDTSQATSIAREGYPFVGAMTVSRTCTPIQAMSVFIRDGFIDRYSGARLVFPGVLRLLSQLLPAEFPFHPNWKMTETHIAFWELFPTIDHVVPIARGGADTAKNMVSTSMLRNSAKSNWTLEELKWALVPPGRIQDWDGLTNWFLQYTKSHRNHLADPYLRRWHNAAVKAAKI